MCRIISRANWFLRRNEGQTMSEYAVVLAVVASTSALLFPVLGNRVISIVSDITGFLTQ